MKAKLNPRQVSETAVTAPHSQERVDTLAKAISHGENFHVTGGTHYTHHDVLKAGEIEARDLAVKQMIADRKDRMQKQEIEEQATKILQQEIQTSKLNADQLRKILLWYGVTAKETAKMKVNDLRDCYKRIKDNNSGQLNTRSGL